MAALIQRSISRRDRGGFAVATLTQPYLRQRDVKLGTAESREAQRETVSLISRGLGAAAGNRLDEARVPARQLPASD